MVLDKAIINELKKIGDGLKEKIDIKKIILFGSYAKGKAKKDSDIDIIIVSREFQGKHFYMRSVSIRDEFNYLRKPIDIICLTPKEFEEKRKQISIISESVKQGKEIIAA